MLDHAAKWDAAPDWGAAALDLKGVTVRSLDLPDLALVSGDLAVFGHVSGLDPQGAGALGTVQGDIYTVRLTRDRLLVVGPLPDRVKESWNEAGFAVTLTGGAEHVFELTGEGVTALLSRATTVDPANGGPAATVGFAGIPSVLYRHDPSGGLRLHVERGLAVYLWSWLKTVLEE
ncbi:sarcosine oxidase subunit gamma family protein [Methylovirgula sp. 4M-Z18]|uniref:sarcosine oxidase subunit gamma family protein n=1 Tax=Methylovirgula sp. 4M-Z18 TaxID=2293567 RepID=UPI000E2ED971|nr:sarcosine oxidase subunit gamma family protein [Methylovirgula sp. 4M-Z18]RFB76693.1 hypothetical protein DYH55_19765 [Methylovirgula sp. 4M-Z18]